MTVSMSPIQFLIHNLVRILLFLLSMFLLRIFIFILINLLPFVKSNGFVLHILYIMLCLKLIFCQLYNSLDSHSIPKSVSEALSDSGWSSVMQEEMTALEQNYTWNLVPLPPKKKKVGCHWVYTLNSKMVQLPAWKHVWWPKSILICMVLTARRPFL